MIRLIAFEGSDANVRKSSSVAIIIKSLSAWKAAEGNRTREAAASRPSDGT